MSVLTKLMFFTARPGQGEALGARLLALVEPSRSELGCLRYDVHRCDEDPNLWFVYENWATGDDFDAHMRTPYVQAFMAELAGLCAGRVAAHSAQRLTSNFCPR
jgi:quinol monooxygenase YgiN